MTTTRCVSDLSQTWSVAICLTAQLIVQTKLLIWLTFFHQLLFLSNIGVLVISFNQCVCVLDDCSLFTHNKFFMNRCNFSLQSVQVIRFREVAGLAVPPYHHIFILLVLIYDIVRHLTLVLTSQTNAAPR